MYEIVKKNFNFLKKIKGKKHEAIMVNLTNLLPEIWDRDNWIKKKREKQWVKGLITKCQRMN